MPAKNARQKKNFRLRIYKNPDSKTYRVDLAVPAAPGGADRTHRYVGTVFKKAADDTTSFEGRVTALNSHDLACDNDLCDRLGTEAGVSFLRLSELADEGGRQSRRKLSAEFLVSSGRYSIEARYSDRDMVIVGTTISVLTRKPSVSVGHPEATRTTSTRRRKSAGHTPD